MQHSIEQIQAFLNELDTYLNRFEGYISSFKELEVRLFELQIEVPAWEEAYDQKLLYTRMHLIHSEIERINRLFGAYYISAAGFRQLVQDNSQLSSPRRIIYENRIASRIDLLNQHEKAIRIFKETLDGKLRLMHATQYMQGQERQSLFQ